MSIDFSLFFKDCYNSSIVRLIPREFADAIIQEVYLEASANLIKYHNELYPIMIRRVQDRCRNLLSGRTVTLKLMDEVLKLTPPTTELSDWCHPTCDIDYFNYQEEFLPSSQSLGLAISKLILQHAL